MFQLVEPGQGDRHPRMGASPPSAALSGSLSCCPFPAAHAAGQLLTTCRSLLAQPLPRGIPCRPTAACRELVERELWGTGAPIQAPTGAAHLLCHASRPWRDLAGLAAQVARACLPTAPVRHPRQLEAEPAFGSAVRSAGTRGAAGGSGRWHAGLGRRCARRPGRDGFFSQKISPGLGRSCANIGRFTTPFLRENRVITPGMERA